MLMTSQSSYQLGLGFHHKPPSKLKIEAFFLIQKVMNTKINVKQIAPLRIQIH